MVSGKTNAADNTTNGAAELATKLAEALRAEALRLGFAACGFAGVEPLERGRRALDAWLASGSAAEMRYMKNSPGRADPQGLLETARSAIVVAACYARPGDAAGDLEPGEGRVARYACGEDYHRVVHEKLAALAGWIDQRAAGKLSAAVQSRAAVDTMPLLERELAMAAGIGFIGKNTLLITPGVGSYTVLGVLLTSLPFPADTPAVARCGSCTLCLEACPTAALGAEGYHLDARRCLSYLTIEHRGLIEDETLRTAIGEWLFGCDACQDACPYNRPTRASADIAVEERLDCSSQPAGRSLVALLTQGSGDYRRLVRGRALNRASRPQLARNAALVAGATSASAPAPNEVLDDEALDEALEAALRRAESQRPEVSAAVRWAQRQRAR